MDSEFRWSNYAVIGRHRYRYKNTPHKLLYYSADPSLLLLRESDCKAIDSVLPKRSDSKLFESLLRRGIIRSDSPRSESLSSINRLFQTNRHVGAFAIMTTHDCNMRCGYCGQNHRKLNMNEETCRKIAEHIIRSVEANDLSSIELRWYGGEPLLNAQAIFDISHRIEKASQLMDFTFNSSMASNGTLLSQGLIQKLVKESHLTELVITLDGYRTAHDLSRPLVSGKPSYEAIRATLRKASEIDLDSSDLIITVRANITNRNAGEIEDLISDLSFMAHNKHFAIQFMPVYEWGEASKGYRLNRRDVDRVVVKCLALASQQGIQTETLPLQKLDTPCLASTTMGELISAEGNIYSCTEYPLAGNDHMNHILGKIDERPSLPRKADELDRYHLSLADSKCGRCPFFPVCGGGCPRKQLLHSADCPSYKTTFTERCDIIARNLGLVLIDDKAEALS